MSHDPNDPNAPGDLPPLPEWTDADVAGASTEEMDAAFDDPHAGLSTADLGADDLVAAALGADAASSALVPAGGDGMVDMLGAPPGSTALVPAGEAAPLATTDLVSLEAVLAAVDQQSEAAAGETARTLLDRTRTPPHALDAERAVLGGLLISESAMEAVIGVGLKPEDFYRPANGIVFEAIRALHNASEPINTITVVERLHMTEKLETVGGAAAIAELEQLMPTAAHVGAFSRLVRQKSTLRQLIDAATGVVEGAYKQNRKVEDILDAAEQAILAISEENTKNTLVHMPDLVKDAMAKIEQMYGQKTAVTGLSTGFRDIDKITSGLQPGELIIVAARPSMGKTAFTLNLAAHACLREQAPVAFFSLEMGGDQLLQRMIGSEAQIDLSRLRRGLLQRDDFSRLVKAAGELSEAPMYIDEQPAISISEMRTKCRRYASKYGIKLIIIDYLQLMRGPEGVDNKSVEVGEISKGLKALARELKVPLIALSQLNRSVESRTDKRPMMSDLRESGSIEQDADLIAFLYREEYYTRENTPEDKIGMAEVIIAKHRNGPTGNIPMRFEGPITRFRDAPRDNEYAP